MGCDLALIAADILSDAQGCGRLARDGIEITGTTLAMSARPCAS